MRPPPSPPLAGCKRQQLFPHLAHPHPPLHISAPATCSATSAGMQEKERPWLKPYVHTPAALDPDPGATRKRPLILVYELPPFYNSVMMQVRHVGAGPARVTHNHASRPLFMASWPSQAVGYAAGPPCTTIVWLL